MMAQECNWPDEECEVCREEVEAEAEYQAWRAKWEGRKPTSPPDPWYDPTRPHPEPF